MEQLPYGKNSIQTREASYHVFDRPIKLYQCIHCIKQNGKCNMAARCIHKTKFGYCGLPL